MKRLVPFAILALACQLSFAQPDQEIQFTKLSEAKTFATEHEVPILMVFAGSDWCKPCIQFKKDILLSEPFQTYAKSHLAILYLDFPIRKANKLTDEEVKQNELLAEKYNPSGGFPQILLLTADETVLGKLSFKNQSPEAFIDDCKSISH